MTRFRICSLFAGLLALALGQTVSRAETKSETPDFQEVYQLIKTHIAGMSEADLNRAAVQGLLATLGPKATLVTNQTSTSNSAPVLSKTAAFEDEIGYVRIARVADDLPRELRRVYQQLNATNKLKGLVLDLRYAGGMDFSAATATADLFIAKAQPLLNWGEGVVSSHEKTNAIQIPVAILVNSSTAGSAEALAGVLRSAGAGLVLGGKTAGQAMVAKEFPLKNGERLRVAVAPVTLGSGNALPSDGLKPDIDVSVNPDDERSYYADAFFTVPKTNQLVASVGAVTNQPSGTNGTRRARFGEAELVREHRAGTDREPGESTRPHETDSEKPVVSDPALARALDLLKGLAVVRQSHP